MRIQDIAKESGVSTATVSRVFGNHPNVRKDVREHVLEVARRHGYHPRLSSRRRNVVVITPSRANMPVQPYTEMMLSAVVCEFSARGYRVEILPEDNLPLLDSIQFCGAVAIVLDASIAEAWNERFDAPLIMLNLEPEKQEEGVYIVGSDEFQGMDLAIGHLAGFGHRKVGAIIFGGFTGGHNPLRLAGIKESFAKRRLEGCETLVRQAGEQDYVEVVGKLLREGVSGLFCTGESSGIMAAYALSLFGRRIPEDVSVVAFERALVSRYCVPAQTAISHDYAALAASAGDALDARLDGQPFSKQTFVAYKMIERDSVIRRD